VTITSGALTPEHYDERHNLLIQVLGRKTLRLRPLNTSRLHPSLNAGFRSTFDRKFPADEVPKARKAEVYELAEGDAMTIPAYTLHSAEVAGAKPSLSLSLWCVSEAIGYSVRSIPCCDA